MNLALFLLRPLSSAGCRRVTCTLLLIRVIPGGWQLLKKDALASLALSGLPELEVLWIQNEHNAGCSGVGRLAGAHSSERQLRQLFPYRILLGAVELQ